MPIRENASEDASGIRPISRSEFQLLRSYIHEQTGIFLGDTKQALVVGRLARRLRALGLKTFGAYYRYLLQNANLERSHLVERISTNETAFFREPAQFEFLRDSVLPQLREEAFATGGRRSIRAWSAGCSTGEEPYSLAMLLLDHLPASAGWTVDIRATDISARVLERGRQGLWSADRAAAIPEPYVKRFMLRGTGRQEGMIKAGPAIRSVVQFDELNLSRPPYRTAAPFDLVFCRNVLIYFEREMRLRVVDHLLDQLTPNGLLFLGHSESLFGQNRRVRGVIPSVYALRGGWTTGRVS